MLHLKIITPQKCLCETEVRMVSLPGAAGRFMVLRDHAPLLSLLEAGEVRYAPLSAPEERLSIAGGFVRVERNEVEIYIDTLNPTHKL